ncbi:MAG: phage tail protein [Candidatus Gastranaerophilaceae bacterium]
MAVDLEKIFDRTEAIETTREYKVNEHETIGRKPHISAGGEVLARYSLPIKLHAAFCNPEEVIEEIEKKAETRANFNYFQHGTYIGDFVIEKIQKKIVKKINKKVFYAEITVDMVEDPDSITEFKDQPENAEKITAETVSAKSGIMQNFLKESKKIIRKNTIDAAITALRTRSLSTALAQVTFNSIGNSILDYIKENGLKGVYEQINAKTDSLLGSKLTPEEIEEIKTELLKLPDDAVDTVLRR